MGHSSSLGINGHMFPPASVRAAIVMVVDAQKSGSTCGPIIVRTAGNAESITGGVIEGTEGGTQDIVTGDESLAEGLVEGLEGESHEGGAAGDIDGDREGVVATKDIGWSELRPLKEADLFLVRQPVLLPSRKRLQKPIHRKRLAETEEIVTSSEGSEQPPLTPETPGSVTDESVTEESISTGPPSA